MSTLRIASVGKVFLDDRVSHIKFRSPNTLLDRDVVLLRLAGLAYEYSTDYATPSYMGAPSISDHDSPRFEADVARRRQELNALLERGGTLVLFVPAPTHWYVDTGERQHSGTGRNRSTTRIVGRRELLGVLPFRLQAEAGESRDLELVAGDPFASFWRAIDQKLSAAAYLTSDFGQPTLRIKGTDAVVGAIAKVGSGIVIVLPQDLLYYNVPDEEAEDDHPEEVAFVDALLELVRELRIEEGEFSQPAWADTFLIPDESEGRDSVATAQERAEAALADVAEAESALARLRRRKTLITGTGKALEILVAEAFTGLGCSVEEGEPGRTDRVMEHPTLGPAVVEAKGKGKSAAEKDCAQLEKWVAEYQIEHETKPKAILVVNAWRGVPLNERMDPAFPDQMLSYAEGREHCLITGAQLLSAWLDAEAHPGRGDEIIASIYASAGRYEPYTDWAEWIELRADEAVAEAQESSSTPAA